MKTTIRQQKANGVLLWQGRSLFDGEDIALIGLKKTDNRKIGQCSQMLTLRTDIEPAIARRSGLDFSICGDCPIRTTTEEKQFCYVDGRFLQTIFKELIAGKYPKATIKEFDALVPRYMRWRLGAYGNPSGVPWLQAWDELLSLGRKWLSYDHEWLRCTPYHRQISMASTETIEDTVHAADLGWRSFLVVPTGEGELTVNRMKKKGLPATICPYNPKDINTMTCDRCGLCDGKKNDGDNRPHVVHEVTGHEVTLRSRSRHLRILQGDYNA